MNLQEFNNLKIGDKVVVDDNLCMDTLYEYSEVIALSYCSQEGMIEEKYSIEYPFKTSNTVKVRFVNGYCYTFNIKDINTMQDKQTKTPHKHADIIKAWADGEEIEMQDRCGNWLKVTNSSPSWMATTYRIKPKFEKRYKYAFLSGSGWYISSSYYKDDSTFRTESGYSGSIFEKIEASGKDFQCN